MKGFKIYFKNVITQLLIVSYIFFQRKIYFNALDVNQTHELQLMSIWVVNRGGFVTRFFYHFRTACYQMSRPKKKHEYHVRFYSVFITVDIFCTDKREKKFKKNKKKARDKQTNN
jgi:hypothetical protein